MKEYSPLTHRTLQMLRLSAAVKSAELSFIIFATESAKLPRLKKKSADKAGRGLSHLAQSKRQKQILKIPLHQFSKLTFFAFLASFIHSRYNVYSFGVNNAFDSCRCNDFCSQNGSCKRAFYETHASRRRQAACFVFVLYA